MLGKLIKHEWKSTYRVGCLMLLLLAIVTFLGWVAFQSPMWQSIADSTIYYADETIHVTDIMSVFTLLLYVIMLVVVIVGIMVYLSVHFYRSMYTDEGYLTHTLPVTKNQLLGSKVLISGIWVMLVILAVYVSLFALMMFMVAAMLPPEMTIGELWREIRPEIKQILAEMETMLGLDFGMYKVCMILSLLISPFTTMIILFGAISLGQLFTKHRVLMAIVSYIGILFINGILGSVVEAFITKAHVDSAYSAGALKSYINTNLISGMALNVVLAAVLYLASYLVTKKKLNME